MLHHLSLKLPNIDPVISLSISKLGDDVDLDLP